MAIESLPPSSASPPPRPYPRPSSAVPGTAEAPSGVVASMESHTTDARRDRGPTQAPSDSSATPGNTPKPLPPVRVVVVDDQPIVRAGLQGVLCEYDDIDIVALVGSGEEALEACARLQPDVVITDLLMPGMGGIELIVTLQQQAPQVHVLALSGYQQDTLIEQALQAGAIGFLLKDVAIEELVKAIRLAHHGIPTLAPTATQALLQFVVRRAHRVGPDLTAQERKVLELLTTGLTNQEIAKRLVVTRATVKFHTRGIYSKLGTNSRTETVILALHEHLVPAERGD